MLEYEKHSKFFAEYLGLLTQHHADTRAHLVGTPSNGTPLEASSLAPDSHWTPTEKAAFFHALTHVSRLRPDLIATEIGSKSEADVSLYLAVLDEGVKTLDQDWEREDVEAAREVSDIWIEWEEFAAGRITNAGAALIEQTRRAARDGELGRKRKADGSWEPESKSSKRRKEDIQESWAKEDITRAYDPLTLTVLQNLIRNLDEPAYRSDSDEESVSEKEAEERANDEAPPPEITPALLADMSPKERRRLTKRMHMRRKRAQARGTEVDMAAVRLKPGRRAKEKAVEERRTLPINTFDPSAYPFKHGGPSGEAARYKIKAALLTAGVDPHAYIEDGLDLISLSRVGELMSIYANALSFPNPPPRILHTTLLLLRAHLSHFLTLLIHRTIVMAEQDRALKGRTKVWRVGDREIVRKEHVLDAVRASGGTVNKKVWLEGMAKRLGVELDRRGTRRRKVHGKSQPNLDGNGSHPDKVPPSDITFLPPSSPHLPRPRSVSVSSSTADRGLASEIDSDALLAEADEAADVEAERALWIAVGGRRWWRGGGMMTKGGGVKSSAFLVSDGSGEESDDELDELEEDGPVRMDPRLPQLGIDVDEEDEAESSGHEESASSGVVFLGKEDDDYEDDDSQWEGDEMEAKEVTMPKIAFLEEDEDDSDGEDEDDSDGEDEEDELAGDGDADAVAEEVDDEESDDEEGDVAMRFYGKESDSDS